MAEQKRRLYRSRTNKVFAGICGGLAEYLGMDATVIRIVWVLLTILGGSGIVLYIIAFFIIPEGPVAADDVTDSKNSSSNAGLIFGVLFVAVGIILLLDNLDVFSFWRMWDSAWDFVLPGILILLGIFILTRRNTSQNLPSEHEIKTNAGSISENQAATAKHPDENVNNQKVFRRSSKDKKILGICGGAGEYFGIDSTIIRVAYAVFTVFSGGMGIILYLLMYLIVPEDQSKPKT